MRISSPNLGSGGGGKESDGSASPYTPAQVIAGSPMVAQAMVETVVVLDPLHKDHLTE